MNEDVIAALNEALARGESAALVTIVQAQGSTPQRVGAKMLVFADGRTVGTIGGGCYEHDAFGKARQALETGQPRLVQYELSDDLAEETGLVCGGRMQVFIEPVAAAPPLYVVGAGHVGQHLARIAVDTGFRVHVVDDREKFASRERFPGADSIVVEPIPEWLQRAELPPTAYVVVVTRGHRQDLDAVRLLAPRRLRYLGLIGSRAKVSRIVDALLAEGLSADGLLRLQAPIGLDIGAVTPAEIAVSIVSELIAVRHGRIRGLPPEVADLSMQWRPKALQALPPKR